MDEAFKELASAVAPEMNNLSSLLLVMVKEPSAKVVDSVI